MRAKPKQIPDGQSLGISSAQRNKTIAAIVLVSLMVFMWVRVLKNKKGPEAAQAAATTANMTDTAQESPKRIFKYIELPQIKGRNDILARDAFSASGWAVVNGRGETKRDGSGFEQESKEQLYEAVGKLTNALKLEAMSSGKTPQAFISGILVSQGQKFTFKCEGQKYELEAVSINDSQAVLRYKSVELKLELPKPVETVD